ncbi:MAG: hypothetical protein ACRDR6_01900 [Pseudonocardiaceae bacterium]
MMDESNGFQVHVATVSDAGQVAIRIGKSISQSAALADQTLVAAVPEAAGLAIGFTLQAVARLWAKHLTELGAGVEHIGKILGAVAMNYNNNEAGAGQSFRAINI